MANLTIRNLDDDIVDRLKTRARGNHRSLEGELRDILAGAVNSSRRDALRALAVEIAALTPEKMQNDVAVPVPETRQPCGGG